MIVKVQFKNSVCASEKTQRVFMTRLGATKTHRKHKQLTLTGALWPRRSSPERPTDQAGRQAMAYAGCGFNSALIWSLLYVLCLCLLHSAVYSINPRVLKVQLPSSVGWGGGGAINVRSNAKYGTVCRRSI